MNTHHTRRPLFPGILIIMLLSGAVDANEEFDPRTLCPRSGSEQQVILLIDTTDTLTLVAQEKLKHLLRAFRDTDNQHYLQPGHELIVYQLTSQITEIGRPLRVCNPGNPDDRTLRDDFFNSPKKARENWRRFENSIIRALPRLDKQVGGKQSPLLESIALVTARHVPNLGVEAQQKPTRILLFSDMLQNSELLSHYNSLPDMATFKSMPGYAAMSSNLSGVDVWMFYVRRPGLENKQTSEHYFWWTQAIEAFGGSVVRQTPL